MSDFVKVKTPSGAVIPGVRDLDNPDWVTVFPGPHKDDEYLQGPAVPVQITEGQPFELVQ